MHAVTHNDDGSVTVSARQWKEIKRDLDKLGALEAGGVDNWEWYGEAMSSLNDGEEDGEDDED